MGELFIDKFEKEKIKTEQMTVESFIAGFGQTMIGSITPLRFMQNDGYNGKNILLCN